MDSLIEGYRRFRASGWPEHRRLFKELAAQGQSPRAMTHELQLTPAGDRWVP